MLPLSRFCTLIILPLFLVKVAIRLSDTKGSSFSNVSIISRRMSVRVSLVVASKIAFVQYQIALAELVPILFQSLLFNSLYKFNKCSGRRGCNVFLWLEYFNSVFNSLHFMYIIFFYIFFYAHNKFHRNYSFFFIFQLSVKSITSVKVRRPDFCLSVTSFHRKIFIRLWD